LARRCATRLGEQAAKTRVPHGASSIEIHEDLELRRQEHEVERGLGLREGIDQQPQDLISVAGEERARLGGPFGAGRG
jgi:hypothetical protein